VKDPWSGIANVNLDGTPSRVDAYADATLYQAALFTIDGLSNGPHTLSIEVPHEYDAHGEGAWVWIDAFDIQDGAGLPGGITATVGRIEDNNPALTYSGNWYLIANAALSGGSAALSVDAGSQVTIQFNGTGISWIAYRDEWSGVARVYLDGALQTTIDTYLSPWAANTTPYKTDGLPPGNHTLTIEATGTRNESSHGAWVWIDAFDVAQ
jgi:alpha-amylase